MSVLTANSLAVSFGAHDVFSGVSATVPPDAKIGLVGPNGCGKTSLLRVLAGRSQPASGSVRRSRELRIGYLRQEAEQALPDGERTVYAEALSAFSDLRKTESRLRALESEMACHPDDASLLERYSSLQEAFERDGGYDYAQRIQRVLTGLGLGRSEWDTPVGHLSGGQKTRVLLAKLLLSQPELLILDEPTNHLSVDAIEWLEGLLVGWEGATLIVSHDRYFLDRVVNVVWELGPTGLEVYRGNYTAYVEQRRQRWALRRKEFRAMKERMDRELEFVRRNIAGQRTQMAQGKLARLSREVEAIHAGGIEVVQQLRSKGWLQTTAELDMARPAGTVNEVAQRIQELRLGHEDPHTMNLELSPARRGGDIVLRTSGLVIGFPEHRLFQADDIQLERGECAALIGGNGTGKTTFLRTILRQVDPLEGELRLGGGVDVGYFAQAHDELDPSLGVIDQLLRARHMPEADARSYLAQFRFRGDEVYRSVSALSGGERGRLALALLALERANLLLLDEPTNHLDIPAQEILQAVLERYEGTVLLVSHDRYLIDRLATQIWNLVDGRLHVYTGSYRGFRSSGIDEEPGTIEESPSSDAGPSDDTATPPPDRQAPLSKNEQRRRAEKATELERQVVDLEVRKGEIERELQEASENGEALRIRELDEEYSDVAAEIERLYAEWDALTEQ